jgi:hypothetical protein
MAAPLPSKLDSNQILKGSYDEANGRIRTDSLSTVVNADIDVNLDASEDSVAIADPAGHFLDVNPDGSINVVVSTGAGSVLKTYYGEVNNIVSGITTLVVSYSTGANDLLQKISFSGTNIAEYELVIDGVTQDKARTYFGSSLNGSFDFNNGLEIASGKLIEVYVVHTRTAVGDFNARIQILEA